MRYKNLLYSSGLLLLVCLIYGQVYNHEFLSLDDHIYVTENFYVKEGITLQGIEWAFTTMHAEFWHPLTWLSLMLDTTIWGGEARGYLFTNLLLHLISSFLIFYLFYLSTSSFHRSWLLAILFAVHPLHVESVAWISDRKDLLCGLFWIASMIGYVQYALKGSPRYYYASLLFFLMALMAKPMAITIPLLFILMDYWPLNRYHLNRKDGDLQRLAELKKQTFEKAPFLVGSLFIGVISISAQHEGRGVLDYGDYSVTARISNSLISLLVYVRKSIAPVDLAIFYPFQGTPNLYKVLAAAIILATFTVLLLIKRKRYPYLIFGWLWFLIALLPVLEFVKIGDFSIADRYMYMPIIGLLVIATWGGSDLLGKFGLSPRLVKLISFCVVAVFSMASITQVSYWKDEESLYVRSITIHPDSYMGHYSFANTLASQGRSDEALRHFNKAVELQPDRFFFRYMLAKYYAYANQLNQALKLIDRIHEDYPFSTKLHYLKGIIGLKMGRVEESIEYLIISLALEIEQLTGSPFSQEMESFREQDRDQLLLMQVLNNGVNKDVGELIEKVTIDPGCMVWRLLLVDKLAEEGSYHQALSYLYIEDTENWYQKALGYDFDWWLSTFPPGSLLSLDVKQVSLDCKNERK